jgi:hypothetical protein
MHKPAKKELSAQQREELLGTLKSRFEQKTNRYKGLEWAKVQAKIKLKLKNFGH